LAGAPSLSNQSLEAGVEKAAISLKASSISSGHGDERALSKYSRSRLSSRSTSNSTSSSSTSTESDRAGQQPTGLEPAGAVEQRPGTDDDGEEDVVEEQEEDLLPDYDDPMEEA